MTLKRRGPPHGCGEENRCLREDHHRELEDKESDVRQHSPIRLAEVGERGVGGGGRMLGVAVASWRRRQSDSSYFIG